jgi:hypothetical protein
MYTTRDKKPMKKKISENTVISVAEEQITGDLLDGEVVILNMKDDVYYGLDHVGGRLWSLIQEPITFGQVIQTLLDEYDVEYQQCSEDVLGLLEDMLSKGLIEVKNGEPK